MFLRHLGALMVSMLWLLSWNGLACSQAPSSDQKKASTESPWVLRTQGRRNPFQSPLQPKKKSGPQTFASPVHTSPTDQEHPLKTIQTLWNQIGAILQTQPTPSEEDIDRLRALYTTFYQLKQKAVLATSRDEKEFEAVAQKIERAWDPVQRDLVKARELFQSARETLQRGIYLNSKYFAEVKPLYEQFALIKEEELIQNVPPARKQLNQWDQEFQAVALQANLYMELHGKNLVLQGIIYSHEPGVSSRVLINDHTLMEGDRFQNMVVKEINLDRVVVQYKGADLMIPYQ